MQLQSYNLRETLRQIGKRYKGQGEVVADWRMDMCQMLFNSLLYDSVLKSC